MSRHRRQSQAKEEGGFDLRILFEGLCGFVPDEPFFVRDTNESYRAGTPSKLSVLLPDARVPGIGDWETGMPLNQLVGPIAFRSSHAPVLSLRPFDVAAVRGLDLAGMVEDPVTGEARLVHVLDREEVTFTQDGGDWPRLGFTSAIPDQQDMPLPPKEQDVAQDPSLYPLRHSLWWLPRMAEIAAHHAWADQDLLDLSPSGFQARRLAARVIVPGGHLSIEQFNSDGTAYWNFGVAARDGKGVYQRPPAATWTWKRAIGTVIQCKVRVPGDEVNIELYNYDKAHSSVTLRPRSENNDVEVAVLNAELESFVIKVDAPWADQYLPDPEFQTLYTLSAAEKAAPRPVPVNTKIEAGTAYKPCSGGLFDGAGEAAEGKER